MAPTMGAAYDNVRRVDPRRSQRLLFVRCWGDREPLTLEVAGHHAGQAGLVIHDQRPVWGLVVAVACAVSGISPPQR